MPLCSLPCLKTSIFVIMTRLSFATLFLLLIFLPACVFSQSYPVDYFTPPLKGVLQLSGTFAELRANHFHSGIDIRTGGKEGLPVYACADGYVVRIRISPGGFGKAVYVNHPNGLTTVYAHMKGFNKQIDTWVKTEQYKVESFDVDLFPPRNQMLVNKGEIIGSSGNSGSSQGPHLHFEVRETATEMPVDPLVFNFPVKDFIRPTLHGLRVYPEGPDALINGRNSPITLLLAGWGPVYRLKITDTIHIAGKFSLGVSASDLLNEASNRNGVVGYEVFIDSLPVFKWKALRFSFSESRYINSFIDYTYYYSTNQRFMRTKTDQGNKLSLYEFNPTKGIFKTLPGKTHNVKVLVTDSKGNESILSFFVKGQNGNADSGKPPIVNIANRNMGIAIGPHKETKHAGGLSFTTEKVNNFATPDMRISLPGSCLYDSIKFEYGELPPQIGMLSAVHSIHKPEIPLHDYYHLSIRVDSGFSCKAEQLVVVRLNAANKPGSVGGVYENGFMKVKLRDFGRYSVMVDSISPVIKPINVREGMMVGGIDNIKVTISDNLSGIRSYRGTLNGAWILMDYDAKNKLLTYTRDARLLPGKNILILTVEDNAGNISVKQWNLNNNI